ncbi:MAG: hypothetical protein H7Z12_10560 [Rhodospirillaceae bacterium]|nr:hypothetical protein [Rhodospirillales bacterium]
MHGDLYYIPDARPAPYVQRGHAFSLGDGDEAVQYPRNWLDLATTDDLAGIGAVLVVTEGEHGDPRLYDNTEEFDGPVRRLVAVPRPAAEVAAMLDLAKNEAKAQVDAAAEVARQRFLTPGSGQAMVYQQKATEARALQAGAAGPFRHLEAEAGITAKTIAEVAAVVLAVEAAWLDISAMIETQRLTAKAAINAAQSLDHISAALAAVQWPVAKE